MRAKEKKEEENRFSNNGRQGNSYRTLSYGKAGSVMDYKCSVCGKELNYKAEKCGDCAGKELKEIFKKNPELKKAYKEALQETFSPENQKKMVDNTVRFMQVIQQLQRR